MKAWQFVGTHEPLALNEVPEPTPGPGTVVVDVKAAGVCHSDVTTLDDPGWMALFGELPRTMGHENAGVISAVGPGMDHWSVGDRVGLAPVMADGDALGYGAWDGGFAPKLLATDDNLVKLPDGVPFDQGAAATDAGLTSFHAIMTVGGAKPGMRVGVIGLGGLGYLGARAAVVSGVEVYAAEVSASARERAQDIGLAGIAESITEFKDKQLDLIVDYAGFGTTTAEAIETLAEFGTLVQVGMGRLEATINTYPLIINQLTVRGSKSGTKEDLAALYELMGSRRLKSPMTPIRHEDVPASIDSLREGTASGRFVILYDE